MSEEQAGQEQTQTAPQEQQSSQNEPYKVYTSEDEYKEAQDKFFRGAYNEGKQKATKDVFSTFANEFGVEAESLDDIVSTVKSWRSPKEAESNNDGELEQLRERLQAIEAEREDYANQLQRERMDRQITSQAQSVAEALSNEGNLKLDMDKIQRLFEMEYDYQEKDGQYYAVKDGVPELDEHGNRKSLADSMADFVRREKLMEPFKQGAGGGTGGTVSADKPKFSEFSKLIRSQRAADRDKAAELRAKAKEVGWDDEDSPQTAKKFRR